jgi:DUF1009 family protein
MSSGQVRLGLIAGYGNLPLEIIRAAEKEGYEIACVALQGMAADNYKQFLRDVLYVSLGELAKTIDFFISRNIRQIFFAGKIFKTELLGPSFQADKIAGSLLRSMKMRNDDAILLELVRLFSVHGIEVLDSTTFLKGLLPDEGCLTPMDLPAELKTDISFGYRMAKEIAGLDIGQTVVVKNSMVLAVEAIEGTDAAILRGGELGKGAAVVVKVAKPDQDLRFDVPTVGLDTIEHCIRAKISVLAFESCSTILLDRESLLQKASENGIHVVSLPPYESDKN